MWWCVCVCGGGGVVSTNGRGQGGGLSQPDVSPEHREPKVVTLSGKDGSCVTGIKFIFYIKSLFRHSTGFCELVISQRVGPSAHMVPPCLHSHRPR